ncbi:Dabb family protein [Alicyclobacillus sp. SO9]|uniref:Dabb family protein n=1 Tax=Alicyclobacillus sp. SO9 TaxID=2665646 RepID=UPI0018E8AA24|nr:Dabb family protein [Alicyclobacillus sp. SO9]QQE77178.1 Dabb family protein [Alicyclobacillus sp. SO9]
MIEHLVWLKFDESTTKEQKDEVIRRLVGLKDEIAGIVDYNAGHNFSERSKGFDVGLRARFVSKAALEKYAPHPKHEAVKQYMSEVGLKESMSLDFEV